MPDQPDDRERSAHVAAEMLDLGRTIVDQVDVLGRRVSRFADLAAERRAIDGRLGRHRHGPDPRELAAAVVCGRLAALRPWMPFEASLSADLAAELLRRDRQLELVDDPANSDPYETARDVRRLAAELDFNLPGDVAGSQELPDDE